IQVVLLAPVQLPGKALNVLKYIAIGLGIVETVLQQEETETETGESKASVDQQSDAEKEVADETAE
ncbi:hypothetical protein, partial [Sphingobacterium sp. LRF_L2]|uniref:hypothetical protein n=1 Tax=Sphingobacterium sp. LRF_L2 TaxID=3369421 RepID=UPI003F6131D8